MDSNRDGDRWGALADGTRQAIVACLAEGPQADPAALAALRDQLDTYWQRALAGYAEAPAEEA